MEADFMYELGKKDPDATIQMIENHTDQLLIQTHVDMEESGFLVRTGPQLTDLIDEELIERESKRRLVALEIRMLRFVFGVQMITALIVATLGYMLFYILNFDESRRISRITFIVSFVCMALVYAALVLTKTCADYIILPTMATFILIVSLWCGALSSMIHTMVPLLTCASVMTQCCAIYAYSLDDQGRDHIDAVYAAGYMFAGHLVAWCVGIFDFAREGAWMWAMIVFFFGLVHIAYATWQIVNIDRYCLSRRDRILALLHFYIDPIEQIPKLVNQIRERINHA